ncbi:DUF1772 domain-containing protein [Paludisphaera mucosa]|uniref:DUF1772 domain-containing protein n=1 Tax=Paludisphaera mucosa TaxID=3030827 RepID=A0ABT6FDN8_9BACT|nr:DUF1772 domain-containing protein [Paludisphaera mucosa]MDG3005694.1 DUF1772 domain-containing protein [Paludisphaera mucosa]
MSIAEASRLVSFGLVVLIWIVQLVVYPGFDPIAPERLVSWHARYTRAITWIVGPLMLSQVALLGWLLHDRPSPRLGLAAAAVAVAWLATAFLAVPAHDALQADGHDADVIRRLVATNWIRTVAWTLAFLLQIGA